MNATLPLDALTSSQLAIIVSIDTVLQHCGLMLTCPTCARDGLHQLQTDNDPKDLIWKIDCHCRSRRATRADLGTLMPPSGDLLLMADQILRPVSLAVRCQTKRCRTTPLEVIQTADGVRVNCPCGHFIFRKAVPTPPH
jgi:hypothetical protein